MRYDYKAQGGAYKQAQMRLTCRKRRRRIYVRKANSKFYQGGFKNETIERS